LNRSHLSLTQVNIAILLAVLLNPSIQVLAQKDKIKLKKGEIISLQDSLTAFGQSDIFDFPNVNKLTFYSHSGKMKKIKQLENSRNNEALYQELRTYVKNFAIENFYKETRLIWQLAKLSEVYGPSGEAALLYRLVIKHHRQDIDIKKVLTYYDSLMFNEKDYYVPLQQYYELVDLRKEIDTLQAPRSVLVNMGPYINSKKPDYGPTLSDDDELLIFTSKRNTHSTDLNRTYDEDLFFSTKQDGYWTEARVIPRINTSYNEGSPCMSKDGKTLYFARCNAPGGLGGCDLYVTHLQKDSIWSVPKNLGENINSLYWDSHPSLSHSGDTLYFSSDRLGGFGLADIYFSVKDKNGDWSKALNAGPIINTRKSEVSPFFHHKFNVLYFSSNGHPLNFGDFDIYKTYRLENSWSDPINIGPLINGPDSEYYFTIDSKSQELYYARSVEDAPENIDLHSFPLPMGGQPEAIARLKGSLRNSETGEPFQGIVSVIDLDRGIEVEPKFLRPDGSFDFRLINNSNYLLIIQGDDFFRIEELFYLDGELVLDKVTEPISSRMKFQSLDFATNKAELLPDMYPDLNKLANFLIDHPGFKLNISGHTDSDGREEANLRLSQARADAIKKYLVDEMWIDASRITAIGYGSSRPIVEERTDEDKRMNRRVEFEIFRD
jgi:outer membrane protein OmpA-like peptidoglycan-associated protein